MGQLAEAKARLASAGTEAEQAKVKIEHGERELKEKEPRAKKAEKEGEGLTKELDAARKEHERLITTLGGLEWDEDVESELLQKRGTVSTKMNELLEVGSATTRSHWPEY
jgi:structural maintenance of chromosome 2